MVISIYTNHDHCKEESKQSEIHLSTQTIAAKGAEKRIIESEMFNIE